MAKIPESGEMYLETLLILSQKGGRVRSIDVANYMDFSKPSVSRAVKKLKTDGFITIEPDGALILTEAGLDIAGKVYERHRFLSEFFVELGVSEDTAVADACKIEHDLSDETFEALKKYTSKCKKK